MEEKTLLDYWLLLYRRRWLILFVMLSAMITTGLISSMITPLYEAKCVFFVPAAPDSPSYLSPPTDNSTKKHMILPMASEEGHAPYLGLLKSEEMRRIVHEMLPHKTTEELKRDVDFSLSDEYLMSVYVRDQDPVKAAAIANAYAEKFNHFLGSYSLSLSEKNQAVIEREIAYLQNRLGEDRNTLKEFERTNGVISPDEYQRQIFSQKADFQSKLNEAGIEQKRNESGITARFSELDKEAALMNSAEFSVESPLLENLRKDLVRISVDMASVKSDIKEFHPDFIKLRNQADKIKENMDTEIGRIVKSKIKRQDTFYETMRRQLIDQFVEKQKIQASMQAYRTILDTLETKIQAMPEIFARIQLITKEIDKNEAMLRTLELKLAETTLQNKRDLQAVVVVDEARVPEHKSFPNEILNMVVAGIAGLAGGIFYCFFINYLEETKEKRLYRILKTIESHDN
jgi:uncharacterized protein involved in exopolysaccharide biosynthesis